MSNEQNRDHERLGRRTVNSIVILVDALLSAELADDDDAADAARRAIEEDALSIAVRTGWHAPGSDTSPEEYNILLGWGGPAMQIVGELSKHGEPESATVETQDWATPWTQYTDTTEEEDDKLLRYAQCFYFGEG